MSLPLCVRVDFDDIWSVAALQEDGWRQVEVLETWRRGIKPFIVPKTTPYIRLATPEDREDCIYLASQSFTHDRLHADGVDGADEHKANWVAKAFAGNDRKVHVAIIDDTVTGFLITEQRQFNCERVVAVDLVAVDERYRKLGVARALLSKAILHHNLPMIAGTQETNRAARGLYRSLDFNLHRKQRTFHKP